MAKRVLPAFDTLDKEADEISKRAWEASSQNAGPDDDPACAAEDAEMAGVDHYIAVTGVRRAVINALAVAVHHLFEQQMLVLMRFEIWEPRREMDTPPRDIPGAFCKTMKDEGAIDVEKLAGWASSKELRAVANTIKHTDGTSADKLRELRPDLFSMGTDPFGVSMKPSRTILGMPAFGEEVVLPEKDLAAYIDQLVVFWRALAEAMESGPPAAAGSPF